jgi:hypothetical protein
MTNMKLTTATLAFGVFSLAMVAALANASQDPATPSSGPTNQAIPPAMVARAKEQGIDLLKTEHKPGLRIVPMSESWFTGELAATMKRQIAEQTSKGFHVVPGEQVPNIARALSASKNMISGAQFEGRRYTSLAEIRPRLFADPIAIDRTPLATARFIEAGTAGGVENGLWTGVARYFDVPGVGVLMLEELDYAVAKASVTMIEEWINTDVNGHPAIAKTAHTADGRVLVSVGWMTDRMSYSLLLEPAKPDDTEGNQRVLLEIARNLGS